MSAKVISFGIQKGGSSKTTSSGITAYILAEAAQVLAVDMDSQGNLTELLTGNDVIEYRGKTVLEAMQDRDATDYIIPLTDNLHILPAEDLLATFSRWLYRDFKGGDPSLVLRETLAPVIDRYDYIIIDTPPALGDATINALAASDYIVPMFEASKFCYSALGRFLETCVHVKERVNPKLDVAGVLRGLIDARRTDNKAFISVVEDAYGDLCFNTILTRTAAAGRLGINGFVDNKELEQALEQYRKFVEELIERVK